MKYIKAYISIKGLPVDLRTWWIDAPSIVALLKAITTFSLVCPEYKRNSIIGLVRKLRSNFPDAQALATYKLFAAESQIVITPSGILDRTAKGLADRIEVTVVFTEYEQSLKLLDIIKVKEGNISHTEKSTSLELF